MATVQCENCNALFSSEEAKCPYCGAVYLPGGEKEYMSHLEQIREDMEDLGETHADEFKKELGGVGKMVRNVLIVVGIVALVFVGLFFLIDKLTGSFDLSDEEMMQRIQWQREVYPILDQMYEEGDIAGIDQYLLENESGKIHSASNWEHRDLMSLYSHKELFEYKKEMFEAGDTSDDVLNNMILDALWLLSPAEKDYDSKEWEYIKSWQAEPMSYLLEMGFEEEYILQKISECMDGQPDYQYYSYSKGKKVAAEMTKRYKKDKGIK